MLPPPTPTPEQQASEFAKRVRAMLSQNNARRIDAANDAADAANVARTQATFNKYAQEKINLNQTKLTLEQKNALRKNLGWASFASILPGGIFIVIGVFVSLLATSVVATSIASILTLMGMGFFALGAVFSIARLWQYWQSIQSNKDEDHEKRKKMKMFMAWVASALLISTVALATLLFPVIAPWMGALIIAALLIPAAIQAFQTIWAELKDTDPRWQAVLRFLFGTFPFPFEMIVRTFINFFKNIYQFLLENFFNRYGFFVAMPIILIATVAFMDFWGASFLPSFIISGMMGFIGGLMSTVISYAGLGFLLTAGFPPFALFVGIIALVAVCIYAVHKHLQLHKAEKSEYQKEYLDKTQKADSDFTRLSTNNANCVNLDLAGYHRLKEIVAILTERRELLLDAVKASPNDPDILQNFQRFDLLFQQYEAALQKLDVVVANKDSIQQATDLGLTNSKVYLPALASFEDNIETRTLNIADAASCADFTQSTAAAGSPTVPTEPQLLRPPGIGGPATTGTTASANNDYTRIPRV